MIPTLAFELIGSFLGRWRGKPERAAIDCRALDFHSSQNTFLEHGASADNVDAEKVLPPI
jgi:hypothetical protein